MDRLLFAEACASVREQQMGQGGIGTLGEKTLHAVLKHYFEPHTENHEIKVGRYVADIVGENGIIEIQTRSLHRLGPKLKEFLACCPVTVVYPVIRRKWLSWIDPDTGEVSKKRRSPKTGSPADALRELYAIRQYLSHPDFTLCVVLFDGEEYRNLDGYGEHRKYRATREERIPTALADELYFRIPADYTLFLPDSLPQTFHSRDLAQCARIHISSARAGLTFLHSLGVVERVGKSGNTYLYQRAAGSC